LDNRQFGAIARERLDMVRYPPKPDNSPDTAWVVLEAASDLGDDATIGACRRVIDAKLNRTMPPNPTCIWWSSIISDEYSTVRDSQ
jgi:hypothetical protein